MIYEYSCRKGHRFERVLPVANYQTPQICECGSDARRVISIPRLVIAQQECRYDSPIDGRPITSRAARRDDLARNNCQEYDPAMRQDAERFRKRADEALDKHVDETVERQIEAMPQRKRERLENELKAGADINIERSNV